MIDVVALASGPIAGGSDTRARVRVAGGGSAANTAAWLAATGVATTYVGRVGDDDFGRSATRDLRAAGVHARVAVDPVRPTGLCVVVSTPDGQRSMFPDTGANAGLDAADLPLDAFRAGSHLHVSGYALLTEGSRAAARAAIAIAREQTMTVSVDPASVGPLHAVGPAEFLAWVDGVDLLMPNEDEATVLAGVDDPLTAARLLAERFGQVVVKLGPAGAAWVGRGAAVTVPAQTDTLVDATGAGDCFAAGFLPAWLDGADPAVALAAGCALAARVVTRHGARP
jgi:sugar/nucleoside kinase (ribokinase family)